MSFICEDKVRGSSDSEELTWFLHLPLQHVTVRTQGTENSLVEAGTPITYKRLNELRLN